MYFYVFYSTCFSFIVFFKGVTSLLTKSKFWFNKFPFIVFSVILGLLLILPFVFNAKMFTLMTILLFSFVLPMSLYLAVVFAYLYIRGHYWHFHKKCNKKHPHVIILSLSWFLICVLVIVQWIILREHNVDFWILKLASLKLWYLAMAAVHLLMLVGFLVYTRCWQHSKIAHKVDKLF